MDESKRRQYAHLYKEGDHCGDPDGSAGADYLDDLKEIEKICENNDLEDIAANRKLYRLLRQDNGFSTWIGEAFLSGLLGQSRTNRHRQTIEKVCKRIAVSFLAMAVVLLWILLRFQMKEAQESAVLDYIRRERELLAAAADEIKDLAEPSTEADTESGTETDAEPLSAPVILEQYAVMYSMYPDLVGWLKLEGTGIDYPVMQDVTGEDYYLTHNFEGREDSKGNPFIDCESSIAPLDGNLVIYGHNMSNGSQFGNLDYYLDPEFYREHSTFCFDTIYETGIYQIAAVVRTHVRQGDEDGFRYYWFRNYESREEFQELLDFISESRVYDTGETLDYGDRLVMLSTCEYTVNDGRLVIIAKRISE